MVYGYGYGLAEIDEIILLSPTKFAVNTGHRRSGEDPEAAGLMLAVQGHPCSIHLHVTRPDVPREGQGHHGFSYSRRCEVG